jgi:cytosine/adenosine deaminase-related metal-dependent hydrolase
MYANELVLFVLKENPVALRDSMRDSAAQYLPPGEPIQAVIGAQTASAWLAALTGALVFLGLNRYRIIAVTPTRIVVLDAGKTSMKKARGVVTELPRSTRLGPGSGVWHRIPAGSETLRVHRRFFKDLQTADASLATA